MTTITLTSAARQKGCTVKSICFAIDRGELNAVLDGERRIGVKADRKLEVWMPRGGKHRRRTQ